MVLMITGILIAGLIICFLGYRLFINYQASQIQSEDSLFLRKMSVFQRKQTQDNVRYSMLILLIILAAMSIGSWQINRLEQQSSSLQEEIDALVKKDVQKEEAVSVYQTNEQFMTAFPWSRLVEEQEASYIQKMELQLAKDWEPYLGSATVLLVISEKTNTMTVSFFSAPLEEADYQQALDNVELMMADLQQVEEIMAIDFHFTYKDDNLYASKETMVYTRDNKREGFDKLTTEKEQEEE